MKKISIIIFTVILSLSVISLSVKNYTEKTANAQISANKDAIENTGGLFGHGGFLGLGI